MEDLNIFSQEEKKEIGIMDKIIEKFIPVIGAILLTVGIGYLLYTNIWLTLNETIKLGLGFVASFAIIGGATFLPNKYRYLSDVVIGIGVLLLYGTLIYGSRDDNLENIIIPETAALISSFIFTAIISFFASSRKSKVILILGMLGAYLTPFVIGQNGSWVQNISFNAFLIYFASVNIVIFQLGKEIDIRNIIPLNIGGLFFGTSSLYYVSYYGSQVEKSFFTGDLFSIVLFFILAVFSIFSIIISSKKFEKEDEGYIAFGYIATVLWFILNANLLNQVPGFIISVFYILMSGLCFYGWYFLKNTKTRYQHTALYSMGVLTGIIAFFNLIPDLNVYTSIIISYSGLVFAGLYLKDTSKDERIMTYGLLASIGGVLSGINIYEVGGDFRSIYFIFSLIPLMLLYFISKKGDNKTNQEISLTLSSAAAILAGLAFLVDVLQYLNFEFIIFYVFTLISLIYILKRTTSDNIKSLNLRFIMSWFIFGYLALFSTLLGDIYPSPTDIFIFNNGGIFSNWIFVKGLFATVILFLALHISLNFQKITAKKRPTYLLFIPAYVHLLIFGNYIIFALINDLGIEHEGIKSVITSIWWIMLSTYMLLAGMKKIKTHTILKKMGLSLFFLTIIKIIFYDMETMTMENKIIVLIIVGGILMAFSFFVQKKGLSSEKQKEDLSLNDIISKVELLDTKEVMFKTNEDKDFSTKLESITKIVLFITRKYGKTEFKPAELQSTYDYIIKNYKTELDKKSYDLLVGYMKNFVEKGGVIEYK